MNKEAKIFDLHNMNFSTANLTEEYIVDTNVLYKLYYSNYPSDDLAGRVYSKFIEHLLNNDVVLRTTSYNIAELLHLIEKAEYECYLDDIGKNKDELSLKEYREIPEQREKIQNELDLVLLQICSMFEIDDITTELTILKDFVENYDYIHCDNYDYSIIQNYKNRNMTNFISHDADYSYIANINLYTMNMYATKAN